MLPGGPENPPQDPIIFKTGLGDDSGVVIVDPDARIAIVPLETPSNGHCLVEVTFPEGHKARLYKVVPDA